MLYIYSLIHSLKTINIINNSVHKATSANNGIHIPFVALCQSSKQSFRFFNNFWFQIQDDEHVHIYYYNAKLLCYFMLLQPKHNMWRHCWQISLSINKESYMYIWWNKIYLTVILLKFQHVPKKWLPFSTLLHDSINFNLVFTFLFDFLSFTSADDLREWNAVHCSHTANEICIK